MNTRNLALALSAAAMIGACSPSPDAEQEPTTEPVAEETTAESGTEPYSRYTIAKQNRILAKQEAGESLTEEERGFLEQYPPMEEEED